MQKRGKDRGRFWLSNSTWLALFLLVGIGVYWLVSREPAGVSLRYGELIQVLESARDNPTVSLQKVKVSRDDIRGEIVTSDPASDGEQNAARVQRTPFRTLRRGLEDAS